MSEVATCPRCDGEKRIFSARSGQSEPCPTCDGTGVVWRDRKTEEAQQGLPGEDNLDLTFRN